MTAKPRKKQVKRTDFWKSLPPEAQKVWEQECKEASEWYRKRSKSATQEFTDQDFRISWDYCEKRFAQLWKSHKHLLEVIRGLITAQQANSNTLTGITERLNTLLAMAEDEQKCRHLNESDDVLSHLELREDAVGEEWTAPWA